jgi:hypothetical protein
MFNTGDQLISDLTVPAQALAVWYKTFFVLNNIFHKTT